MEDKVNEQLDPQVKMLEVVGKLNQKDHAQGHICPDVKKWISQGPYNLMQEAKKRLKNAEPSKRDFYQAMVIALEGACVFIERYGRLASRMADKSKNEGSRLEYLKIAESCYALSKSPASNFREAVQSLWFLFVILQMESNASSFSPGRADQYLYPYYIKDMRDGTISLKQALELIEALFIKFNQIVYMRNTKCAEFFAGFPIGFNIAIGGHKY
ncbi:MAG: pyruvate formate lyase family protein [Acetivibrionales bacterium]